MALLLMFQATDGGFGVLGQFLPLILIFVIVYFLLILPMQRRQKQQKEMLANLKNGDRVVTTGGIRGTIVSIKDDSLHLRVPPQDVRLEIVRSAVTAVETPAEK